MFAIVKRRLRPLIYLLVAAQLLLSAPVVNALASASAGNGPAMECEGHEPATSHTDRCPCCPDGAGTDASCLAACTANVGATPVLILPQAMGTMPAPATTVIAKAGALDDPPLKPPPIR
jgi:hypothetical protein